MSLRIWLQFKGNIENKGEEVVKTADIGGIHIDDDGKVGGCIHLFEKGQGVVIPNYMQNFSHYEKYSITAWIKVKDAPIGHSATILSSGDWNDSRSQCCFALYDFTNNGYNKILVPNLSGWSQGIELSSPILLDKWYHIAVIYNGIETQLFINGELIGKCDFGGVTTTSNSPDLYVGRPTYTSYFQFIGDICDLRIYNRDISNKEVKEISKGLMINYTLTQKLNAIDNCFLNPTFSSTESWQYWGSTGHKGGYGQNTDKNYIFYKNEKYSTYVSNGSVATKPYLIYQVPNFNGGMRSLQAIIKGSKGEPINENICYPAWNANTSPSSMLSKWTSITHLGDDFYLCKCEGFSQDGTNNLVGIYVNPGYTIFLSRMYLENYKDFCSEIFHREWRYERDKSGFSNDGAFEGNPITVKESEIYDFSYYWPKETGFHSYIFTPILTFDGDACTFNVWVKLNGTPGGSGYQMPLESDNGSNYEMSITSDGRLRGGMVINGTRYVVNCSNRDMNDNKWHMLTLTYDGYMIRRYVDAKEYESTEIKGKSSLKTIMYIGTYGTNNSYHNKDIYENDVRIYATTLRDEDIMQLYNTRAIIDNKNVLHQFEINETDENLLKHDYIIKNCRPENHNTTCGTWTVRNGINCMAFSAGDCYYGSDDERTSRILDGYFRPNESYVFNLWYDADDLTYNNNNVPGGFNIVYTDGTVDQLVVTGNYTNKIGFQNVRFVSDYHKTIRSLGIYYYVGNVFFVRWDSFIVKSNKLKINKNGIIDASYFIESKDNENVKFYKGGIIKCSELDKI